MDLDLAVVDRLLTTTRTVRKRLDLHRPVEKSVILECLRLAIQAPNAGNAQNWAWLVVTDPVKRAALAEIYVRGAGDRKRQGAAEAEGDMKRVAESAVYLLDHLQQVPVHIVPCVLERENQGIKAPPVVIYGSIFPAVWSLQLALRSRGLGSALLHIWDHAAVADLLDIPESATLAGLVAVGHYTGDTFRPARRRPIEEVTYWNRWEGGS